MIEGQECVVESCQMAATRWVGVQSSVVAIAPFSSQSYGWYPEMVLHRMELCGKTSLGAAGYVLCCQNSLIAPQIAKL